MTDTVKNNIGELTEAENELYDRQIRLWGLESQMRLRTAKVLISGLDGIGAEVTKNIILSGVNSVTLNDDKLVTEEDSCSQFLTPRNMLGHNRAEASIARARKLNPMVEISADTEPLEKKDATYFEKFDVVVIIGAQNSEILRIDEICRERNIKFLAGDVWGMFGFYFADFQQHDFVEDITKHKIISKPHEKLKSELTTTTKQRSLTFPSYAAVLDFDINSETYQKKAKRTGSGLILLKILQQFREEFNRDPSYKTREMDVLELQRIRTEITSENVVVDETFLDLFGKIAPAAAVVGGILSQEIIKVITKKEAPHYNVFLFDPETHCGFVEAIG